MLQALWAEYRDGPLADAKYQSLFTEIPAPVLKMVDSPYKKSSPPKRPTLVLQATNVIYGVAKPKHNGIYCHFSVFCVEN